MKRLLIASVISLCLTLLAGVVVLLLGWLWSVLVAIFNADYVVWFAAAVFVFFMALLGCYSMLKSPGDRL